MEPRHSALAAVPYAPQDRTERRSRRMAVCAALLAGCAAACGARAAGAPPSSASEAARPAGPAPVEQQVDAAEVAASARHEHLARTLPPDDEAGESDRAEPELPEPVIHPFHAPLPPARLDAETPAMRYANLSPAQCRAELRQRKLPVERAGGPAPGIATPLRLEGPLRGVRFVAPRKPTPYGMLDCRLALTLDDLAAVLAEHGVVEVRVDNYYRPRARLPGRARRSQHAYGLAADILSLTLEDGHILVVERDWHGERREPPCGPDSRLTEESEDAVTLRSLFCTIAGQGFFHHLLTPSYDAAHENHLHLDIKRDAEQSVVR